MHNPPHPCEILREWMHEISVTDAAKRLGVTRVTLSRVLNGAADISPEMDVRLSRALGTSLGTWYKLQAQYDLWHAEKNFKGMVIAFAKPKQATIAPSKKATPNKPSKTKTETSKLHKVAK